MGIRSPRLYPDHNLGQLKIFAEEMVLLPSQDMHLPYSFLPLLQKELKYHLFWEGPFSLILSV